MCKVVQNMYNFPKNVSCAKWEKLCILFRVLNKLCKMCKIEQSIHNCVKCANRPKRCDPGDQADQANCLLLTDGSTNTCASESSL